MKRQMTLFATASLAALALALVPATLDAKVIKVVSSGSTDAIQQGVNSAQAGDTVIVEPGTYFAGPYDGVYVWPDKTGLKLKAAGQPGSVRIVKAERPLDDYEKGIAIMADDVLVEGFDISGFWSGIYGGLGVESRGGRIFRNIIHGCISEGIIVSGSSDYEIGHNSVDGAFGGIFLNGANTEIHIHHNRVTAAQGDGIRVWMSPGCAIDHNVCENNEWDGIYLAQSPACTAAHNRSCNNNWNGIEVGGSPGCTVSANKTCANGQGMIVWLSCGTRFQQNLAEGNEGYDLFAVDWEGSDPTCNTYFNNRADTAYPCLDLWDVKSSE